MELFNASELVEREKEKLVKVLGEYDVKPKLRVVQVEGDPASNIYVGNKIKIAKELGIEVEHIMLDNNIKQYELNKTIADISNNDEIDGLIVQLPLPDGLSAKSAIKNINWKKDVDGLTDIQQGKLSSGKKNEYLIPCTAYGVLKILKTMTTLQGKDVVIINRSDLIGKPLYNLLLQNDCTVTICHSKTKNLKDKVKNADIVITGIAKAHFFDETWFRNGQYIVDCSMNRLDGKLVGDVNIESLKDLDIVISSGKGQTGPMTVLALMYNTTLSFLRKNLDIYV